jgi:hypothetical protein
LQLILPLSTWIMKGLFRGPAPNLERAALVDGCTRLQAIRKIIMPVARRAWWRPASSAFSWLERVHLRAHPHQHAAIADHPGDHRGLSRPAPLLRLRADVRGQRARHLPPVLLASSSSATS